MYLFYPNILMLYQNKMNIDDPGCDKYVQVVHMSIRDKCKVFTVKSINRVQRTINRNKNVPLLWFEQIRDLCTERMSGLELTLGLEYVSAESLTIFRYFLYNLYYRTNVGVSTSLLNYRGVQIRLYNNLVGLSILITFSIY